MAPDASTGAALSASLSLVALQIGSRLFSFGLNQLLLRATSPDAFGVATIQLDTLLATLLFFLREGLRGAVARAGPLQNGRHEADAGGPRLRRQQTLLLPVLLSPLAVIACALFYTSASPASDLFPAQYPAAYLLYALSGCVELLAEPFYLETVAEWQHLTTRRVKVEGYAILVKALATLAAVRLVSGRDALLAFGVGQLAYSATIWIGLAAVTGHTGVGALLSPLAQALWIRSSRPAEVASPATNVVEQGRYFDGAVLETGWALTKQSFVKQLLTEADKLAVGQFGSTADMGGYAVALNYGSLIARVVFQPLEESSRLYFSSLAAATSTSTDAKEGHAAGEGAPASTGPKTPPLSALGPCAAYLRLVLLLQTHLALIFFLLAPSYTTPLLHLLLGPKWSLTSAAPILRAYARSLPFLGLNGITESFVQAVADPEWIQRGAGWMVICGGAFAATVWYTVQRQGMGAVGLVVANCVNMALRTAFSSVFLVKYFRAALTAHREKRAGGRQAVNRDQQAEEDAAAEQVRRSLAWRSWTPTILTLATFLLGGYVCQRSEARWSATVMQAALLSAEADGEGGGGGGGARLTKREELWETGRHLLVGAGMGLLGLASIAFSHREEIRSLFSSRRGAKASGVRAEEKKRE